MAVLGVTMVVLCLAVAVNAKGSTLKKSDLDYQQKEMYNIKRLFSIGCFLNLIFSFFHGKKKFNSLTFDFFIVGN